MPIELHQFPTGLGMPNISPFCMKLETWLRLAGLPYEIKWQPDSRKAPVGKLPMVVVDGEVICDSERIIQRLSQKQGIDLDAGLSPQQRAQAHAMRRMLEENTYWGLVYSRWIDPQGWSQFWPVFFGKLPAPVRAIVTRLVRKQIQRDAWGHGMGRHPPADVYARAAADLEALSLALGEQPFFFGAQPTNFDATAYGFLGNICEPAMKTPLNEAAKRYPNLVAYCARMRERCFPG